MEAENGLHRRVVKNPGFKHQAGAAGRHFFPGLEDKNYRAVKLLAPSGQQSRRPQDHSHVGVMTASVHPARVTGGELYAGIFLQGQSVHIGPQGYGRAVPGSRQDAHHPGAADTSPDLQPQFFQHPGYQGGCLPFRKAELRTLVQLPPPGHQTRFKSCSGGEKIIAGCHQRRSFALISNSPGSVKSICL
jgi:hypothetical protein